MLPLDQAIHLSIDCACKLFSLATIYLNRCLCADIKLKNALRFHNAVKISCKRADLSILASLDVKKKLYGSVLVVGGGLSFPGAPLMLQQRLYSKLPPMFQRSSDAIEVCSNPKVCHTYTVHSKIFMACIFCAQIIDQ